MTRTEFLEFRNPHEKYHGSDSYDFDLLKMNQTLQSKAFIRDRGMEWTLHVPYGGGEGFVVTRDGTTVAVIHQDILFVAHKVIPDTIPRLYGRDDRITWSKIKVVKYPEEYVPLVSNIAKRNRQAYNHLLQHITIKGELFQVRSNGAPVPNEGTSLAILNSKDEVVAEATDEWGATLLSVAQEYRGRGLGKVIGKFWYELNPEYTSGGFTSSGEANALRLWEERVREFSANGWYSALLREGRIDVARVKKILEGLSGKRPSLDLPEKPPIKQETKPKTPLIYAEDEAFVVYDKRFLEDQDEKYLFGHGFFRDNPNVGMFLYTLDYDRPYRVLTTLVALQMAKDQGHPVYVGKGYGDLLELDGIPGVIVEGNYAKLEADALPLGQLSRLEQKVRRNLDKYGELKSLLLEMAESKW